jgi:hypothetical protein
MLKKLIIPAAALVAILGYGASPYITLSNLQDAVTAKDAAAIQAYVSWDDVRANLKADLMAEIEDNAEMKGNPLAATFGQKMIDGLVDSMITPEMLATVVENGGLKKRRQSLFDQIANRGKASDLSNDKVELESAFFTGLTTFGLTLRKGDDTVDVELGLDGLGWKITRVRLPMEALQ